MKSNHKFDYRRFADHLVDRGLVDNETIEHVLEQCDSTGALMPELLVQEGLVSDWEVARLVCELYHLPFLPVEVYPPAKEALEGLDPDYLRQYALVPCDRFGKVLTVVLPGIVPTEVLAGLVTDESITVVPLIGSVTSNRRWLGEHLPRPSMEGLGPALPSDDWENIFDAGEEAVQLDLQGSDLDDFDLDLGDITEAAAPAEPEPAPARPAKAAPKPKPNLELRLKGEDDAG